MPGMDGFINFNGTLEGSIAGGGGGDVTDVKVRDSQETTFESVVNEQGVAEIDLISYVRRNELTQAIENVENSIDNVEQLVDTKQNIINYSTEEQNTGVKWIDGKDIFCRTLQIDNFNINQSYEDLHYGSFNITDYIMGIDKIFGVIDKSYIIAGNDQRGIVSIQPEYPSILILNNRNISNVTLIVTLEYTKL